MTVHTFVTSLVLVEAGPEKKARVSFSPQQRENRVSRPISNRGIVLASLVSGVLWAALIIAMHALWMLLH